MYRSWWLALWAAAAVLAPHSATGDEYHGEGGAWEVAGARAARVHELSAQYWQETARAELAALVARGVAPPPAPARNVIMFIGDGMSVPTLAAARTLQGQRAGRPGEEDALCFETFPTLGMAKTYCVNAQIPDSACTATAFLSGVKTNQGLLGLSANVTRRDCEASLDPANQLASIAAWALDDGRDVGIVTTTRITHATPAAAYARCANRNWESDANVRAAGLAPDRCPDIAHQLVHHYPGNNFKVIFGGGLRELTPVSARDVFGTLGRRTDGRDLVHEWAADKRARNVSHAVVHSAAELDAAVAGGADFLLGMFASTHLEYALEAPPTQPSLAALTAAAVRVLARNPRGYFLLVEGGRIDHAHHGTRPALALDETLHLAAAVTAATDLVDPADTLVLVTADHSHVMTFNGYTGRGSDILGPSRERDAHGVPYMTLSYTNGPGARPHVAGVRPDVTLDNNFMSARWRAHADAPLASETHGGEDVAVHAWGAGHGVLAGLYEQSALPHRVAWAACLPASTAATMPPAPHCTRTDSAAPATAASTLLALTAAAALILHCF